MQNCQLPHDWPRKGARTHVCGIKVSNKEQKKKKKKFALQTQRNGVEEDTQNQLSN